MSILAKGEIEALAALRYTEKNPGKELKNQPADTKSYWFKTTNELVNSIGKMGWEITQQGTETRLREITAGEADRITEVIKAFVNQLSNTNPKFFPCRELALRILEGRKC